MSNIIDAIINLLNHPVTELKETYVRKIEQTVQGMHWRNM